MVVYATLSPELTTMKSGILVGFIVEIEDGRVLEVEGAVLVFGESCFSHVEASLKAIGQSFVGFAGIFAEDIFDLWEQGRGPALAFDRKSFRAFDPIATARSYSPVGTLLFSLTRELAECEDIFIIFSPQNSRS